MESITEIKNPISDTITPNNKIVLIKPDLKIKSPRRVN